MNLTLPYDVTRRERLVLFAALLVCDKATGEVRGAKGQSAKRRLLELVGHLDAEGMRRTLGRLERRGYLRRVLMRLFVALPVFSSGGPDGQCEGCLSPLPKTQRAAARWCASCRQVLGREDRAWQPKAITLLVAGKSPPEIAHAVRRPLWRSSDGSNQASAVVPFLLEERLLGEEWREWLRRATEGGADP